MITYRSFLAFMLRFAVAQAAHYPVGITNCGISEWIDKVPQRAVTMNQGTTEVMLALGLEDHMVGTAYLDDEIWPELADSYRRVTVLNERGYPDAADLFAVQPDFIYGSYSSAFATSSVNYTQHIGECNLTIEQSNESNRTFCRQELHDQGIQTYLQKPYCEQIEHRPDAVTLDVLFSEIWDIATIFNAFENARQLVDSIDDHFDMAIQISEAVSGKEPIRALWLDGWDDETPFVGACCGAVQVILEHAGAKNIFESLGLEEKKSWDSVPWEEIATLDPDLIVLVDAAWDLAGKNAVSRRKKRMRLNFLSHQYTLSRTRRKAVPSLSTPCRQYPSRRPEPCIHHRTLQRKYPRRQDWFSCLQSC